MNEIMYYLAIYGMYMFYILLLLLILRFIFKPRIKNYHSNWNTLIDNFSFSTEEFYKLLKEELLSQGIKNVKIRYAFLQQGNIFSSRRTYLRVEWREFQFDFCAAPFGRGFFLSWWLLYKNSIGQILLSKIPFIGGWLVRQFYPITYYKVDTASMFMTYAQSAVLKVIDAITKSQGIRVLSESERKPVLQDIFKR